MMPDAVRELRYAVRRLRASPAFTLAATLTLAGAQIAVSPEGIFL
jgi:hypothetical protein